MITVNSNMTNDVRKRLIGHNIFLELIASKTEVKIFVLIRFDLKVHGIRSTGI